MWLLSVILFHSNAFSANFQNFCKALRWVAVLKILVWRLGLFSSKLVWTESIKRKGSDIGFITDLFL